MNKNSITVPALAYDEAALGPYISADIMRLHHDKHHQAYVDKYNHARDQLSPELQDRSTAELLASLDQVPVELRTVLRNNAGGHYNHSQFWQWLSPQGGGQPTGELGRLLEQHYGSYQAFVDQFSQAATDLFGSGWVWLMPDLTITTSPNQDSPLMTGGPAPLLGLDVWEHAYYLDYKNNRADYIAAWWNVVNWQYIEEQRKA